MRLILFLSSLTGLLADQCFYPDHSNATNSNYERCPATDSTFAQCCVLSENDTCHPNGLCNYPGHYMYRGACADKTWGECQQICPQVARDNWVMVKTCAANEYCCDVDGEEGDCCSDVAGRFGLSSPEPSTTPSSSTTGGLSGGAKGAIGGSIGGVAAIAIGIGAWWMLRRKKKNSVPPEAQVSSPRPIGGEEGKVDGRYYPVADLAPSEMDASSAPVESDSRPVERREVYEVSG